MDGPTRPVPAPLGLAARHCGSSLAQVCSETLKVIPHGDSSGIPHVPHVRGLVSWEASLPHPDPRGREG